MFKGNVNAHKNYLSFSIVAFNSFAHKKIKSDLSNTIQAADCFVVHFLVKILLTDVLIHGTCLLQLATNYYWAGLGVGPDKTGFTSIFLEYSKLRQNELGENYLILSITRTFDNM